PRGVSVKPGIRRSNCVHFRRGLSAIHPDFPPRVLLLKKHEHAIRRRIKPDSSPAAEPVIEEVRRETEGIAKRKRMVVRCDRSRIIGGPLDRVVELQRGLARRRHRRIRAHLHLVGSDPNAVQIMFGSWTGWIWHCRNSGGDKTRLHATAPAAASALPLA